MFLEGRAPDGEEPWSRPALTPGRGTDSGWPQYPAPGVLSASLALGTEEWRAWHNPEQSQAGTGLQSGLAELQGGGWQAACHWCRVRGVALGYWR